MAHHLLVMAEKSVPERPVESPEAKEMGIRNEKVARAMP